MYDTKTIILASISGIVPAIVWLWFWLKEQDKNHPEPLGLIVLTCALGAISVIFAIGLQRFVEPFLSNDILKLTTWAGIEEILKFLAVVVIVFGTGHLDEPIDFPMYFIASAIGFAALENILFLLNPISTEGTVVGLITGNLRFLGSNLVHILSSAFIGSAFGLTFYKDTFSRFIYVFFGIILSITLHTIFNFFIIKEGGENFLQVFGFIWIIAIINILIFEKLKRMGCEKNL